MWWGDHCRSERWVRTMLSEEYGLPQEVRNPWLAAMSTFSAFVLCGLPSFSVFLRHGSHLLAGHCPDGRRVFHDRLREEQVVSCAVVALRLSTLTVGLLAAGLAYGAGMLLKGLI
jgi:hypothetical protein